MWIRSASVLVGSGILVASTIVGFAGRADQRKDVNVAAQAQVEVGAKKVVGAPKVNFAADVEPPAPPPAEPPIVVRERHPWVGREAYYQEFLISQLNETGFVPKERRDHYRWIAGKGDVIARWVARATAILSTEEGVVVTLCVHAEHLRRPTRVNDLVYETYLLTDDGPILLAFRVDPRPKITTF